LIIIAFFSAEGVWPQMRYCVFEHNLIMHTASMRTYLHVLTLPVALPLLFVGARKVFRNQLHSPDMFRPLFLLFAGCAYFLILESLWGHITRQDFLPFYPLAAIIVVAGLSAIPSFGLTSRIPLPAFAAILMVVASLLPRIPRANSAAHEVRLVREVLKLTKPDDYVFDRKGETVFRRRSFYYVLEGITRERLKRRLLQEDAEKRCVETRTCVAVSGSHIPLRDEHFLTANYLLGRGHLRVAGYFLHPSPADGEAEFNVAIPAEYELVAPNGNVSGLLDGAPYDRPRFLDAGKHHFRLTSPAPRVAVVWAQAVRNNFSPFPRRRRPSI
jgi:hypothetical protein